MLLYTTIAVVSCLVAVPIIILIYEAISLANQAASDFSCDELIATTGYTSGQKCCVTSMNQDYANSKVGRNQDTARPPREEQLASAESSFKVGAKEVPGAVTLESVCKPFKRKVHADTLNSETMKTPIVQE